MRPEKFITTNAAWKQFQHSIKLYRCPHCQRTGCLILHSYLYGYDDKNKNQRIIRGRRIFCSNRGHRQGCGRTFSILTANRIKKFIITTQSLWDFLNNIFQGLNKLDAFRQLGLSFSISSIYRLYKKIYLRQSFIRSQLLQKSPPPQNIKSGNPLVKTIQHMKSVLAGEKDPFAAFQSRFQVGLLG